MTSDEGDGPSKTPRKRTTPISIPSVLGTSCFGDFPPLNTPEIGPEYNPIESDIITFKREKITMFFEITDESNFPTYLSVNGYMPKDYISPGLPAWFKGLPLVNLKIIRSKSIDGIVHKMSYDSNPSRVKMSSLLIPCRVLYLIFESSIKLERKFLEEINSHEASNSPERFIFEAKESFKHHADITKTQHFLMITGDSYLNANYKYMLDLPCSKDNKNNFCSFYINIETMKKLREKKGLVKNFENSCKLARRKESKEKDEQQIFTIE